MPDRFAFARALRHRNYRLFFVGQGVSLVGTWVTRVATSWLVWRLTHSEWQLGLVSFAGLAPQLVLGPGAGVFVDRWDRRRTLVATQVLSALQSAALAALAFSGAATVAHIVLLQVLQGIIGAIDTPARQAFVVEMVDDRADLPNAIALNSSMFNASRIVGPAVGGALLAATSEAWCFALDAVSYVAVILSLLAMHLSAERAGPREALTLGGFATQLREGLAYARDQRAVRGLLLLVAMLSILAMPYTVLMPALAQGALGGGANALGWLMTSAGAGALVGTALLAARTSTMGLGRVMIATTFGLGLALVAFALACAPLHALWLALALLPFVGGTLVTCTSGANTLLQGILPGGLRGRVMALYSTAFLGAAPLGSVLAGALAARIGAPKTVVACGVACLGVAIWFWRAEPAMRAAGRAAMARQAA